MSLCHVGILAVFSFLLGSSPLHTVIACDVFLLAWFIISSVGWHVVSFSFVLQPSDCLSQSRFNMQAHLVQ